MKTTGPTEIVMWASAAASLVAAAGGAAAGNLRGAGIALVIAVVITMVTFAERRRAQHKYGHA
ncbi:hypothetical protein FZ103_15800 [Streptomonospora sp. PA3]|uniref:hypothetical protein n=1 Tax=Streptomonospora sp. PA3 TaxID=2607326 RepID=UPI0012DC9E6A|nr:hypothetical protein [Streptomonospora sp. PA3]MUL42617.1 hypothetical protein [Streptomonospora sp. PA3]